MGSSGSKIKVSALPAIGHLPESGIPSSHFLPPGFDTALAKDYIGVLECLYYGQRLAGIERADKLLDASRAHHPLEHASAIVLRSLFDLTHDIKVEPRSIADRNQDGFPELEGSIASVASMAYSTYGDRVLTVSRKGAEAKRLGPHLKRPIEKVFDVFMPILVSTYQLCDTDMIAIGSKTIFSDLQIFFHIFYNHCLLDDEIWVNEGKGMMTDAISSRRSRIGSDFETICRHLHAHRRVDLALFFIKHFADDTGTIDHGGLDSEIKKCIRPHLLALVPLVTTKHQGAMLRYLAYHMLLAFPVPAPNELPYLHDAFVACGDGAMELEAGFWSAASIAGGLSPRIPYLRHLLQRAAHLQQVRCLSFILKAIVIQLAQTQWTDPTHSQEVLHLLVDYERIETVRLGPKLHSQHGSMSNVYPLLALLVAKTREYPFASKSGYPFASKRNGYPLFNQVVIALYAHNFMQRYPPRYNTGVDVYDKVVNVQLQWFQSFGLDLDSEDSEAHARMLHEWVKCVQAAAPLTTGPVESRASSDAIKYATWLIRAGRSSLDGERGIRLLEEADEYMRTFDKWLWLDEDYLQAVRTYQVRLEVFRYHPLRSSIELLDCEPYQRGQHCCHSLLADQPDAQAEAMHIMHMAKAEICLLHKSRGIWRAQPVTTIQDGLSPGDLAAKREAKRQGCELLSQMTSYLDSITLTKKAYQRIPIVSLPLDFNNPKKEQVVFLPDRQIENQEGVIGPDNGKEEGSEKGREEGRVGDIVAE